MFTGLVVMSAIGIALLGSGATHHELTEEHKHDTEKFSRRWVRENLSVRHYDNWNVDDITYQLKDNWIKDDVEYLMRNGYSFEYAIDELVKKGKINL